LFAKHIRSVFSPAFRESPNSVKKKLLTLLKTWYIYYPPEILNTIYNELELAKHEPELLTPEDQIKIKKFIENARKEDAKKAPAAVRPVIQQPPMS
jgi:hypothetical protein